MTDHIQPGDWIAGSFWEAPVQVITRRERSDHDLVAVNAPHLERSRAYVLTSDDWAQVRRVARADYGEVGFTAKLCSIGGLVGWLDRDYNKQAIIV